MIYLILQKNGMGNQMFCYAYGRYLQELYSQRDGAESMGINAQCFHDGVTIDYIDPRDLSLKHFRLGENVTYLNEIQEAQCHEKKRWQTLRSMGLWDSIRLKIFKKKRTGEDGFVHRSRKGIYFSYEPRAFYPTVLCRETDKFVFGHFLDRRYSDSIRDILSREFQVITPASAENQAMCQIIQSCNSVCMHVRRGDYLNPHWAKLRVCEEAYYQKAVEKILERVEDPVFFVFSNTHEDLLWIRDNYHLTDPRTGDPIKLELVDLSNPDYEEFRLMRACKHFIIPNSTFSWWAAYLADESSVVCAPDRWDLTIPGDAAMNCPEWVIIETGK